MTACIQSVAKLGSELCRRATQPGHHWTGKELQLLMSRARSKRGEPPISGTNKRAGEQYDERNE